MNTEKISLVLEKPLFTNSGLEKINHYIYKHLLEQNEIDIHISSFDCEHNHSEPYKIDCSIMKTDRNKNESDIIVLHQWPSKCTEPISKHLIFMQSWEVDSNPSHWYNALKDKLSEIWVHSNYCKNIYIQFGIPENKIKVIPLGVDETIYNNNIEPLELDDDTSFRFLFIDDPMEPSAINTLLEAYYQEFSADEDVCLVIKMSDSIFQKSEKPFRNTPSNKNPRVVYLNKQFSEHELAGLYKACSCIVQLRPEEGFGMPIKEAMACGTPAIVPNNGPTQDYCDINTSFFLNLKNEKQYGSIEKTIWSKVNQKELQKMMRYVYKNQAEVNNKGQKASEKILSSFTWKQTANIILYRIKQIVQSVPIEDKILYSMQLYKANRVEEAINLFLNILSENPNSIETHYNIAIVYMRSNKYSAAIPHFLYITKAMSTESKDFQANIWYYLGVCYSLNQSYTKAVDAFHKAITINPSLRTQEIFLLKKLIQKNTKAFELYQELGNCYFHMGNDFQAEAMFMKALESGGEQIPIVETLKQVYERIYDKKKCITLNQFILKESYSNQNITWQQSAFYPSDDSDEKINERRKLWETYFVNGNRILEIQWTNKTNINIHEAEPKYDGVLLYIRENFISANNLLKALKYCFNWINHLGKIIIMIESQDNTPVSLSSKKLLGTILNSAGWSVKDMNLLENEESFYIVSQKTNYDVLWQSVIFNSSGYAEEQNHFLDAMKPYPLKIKVYSVDPVPPIDQYPPELKTYLLSLQNQQLTSPLIHYQAAPADAFSFPIAPISIGRTMFETDSLPISWVEILNEMTEIWVPSEFNQETFASAGVKLKKIKILPEPLDENKYNPLDVSPYPLQVTASFKFLSVFDWSPRKGWEILIQAYFEEFSEDDDVTLILKVSKINEPNTNPYAKIKQLTNKLGLKKLPHIHIIQETLSQEEIIRLYAAADCFVLPSRGEGWGRPYMEAMAMELPTIGTRWSGQQAFMNDDNSYLINIDGLIPVDPNGMPAHFHGHKWANPSVDHLKFLMRYAYEHPEEAKKKGIKARKDLFPQFSRHTIGKQIYQRIDELVKYYYR